MEPTPTKTPSPTAAATSVPAPTGTPPPTPTPTLISISTPTPTPRVSPRLPQAITWDFPPTIDGEYLHFAGTTSEPWLLQEFVMGNNPYCSQFHLYQGPGRWNWLTSIEEPLLAGWHYEETPGAIIVNGHINTQTGEFSVTARINDKSMANTRDLYLAVESRVLLGADGFCLPSETFSETPVDQGNITEDLKSVEHFHLDAIQWIDPPNITGDTMRFSGKASSNLVRLTWEEGYCGQFHLYDLNESGYHYMGPINPLLPSGRSWTDSATAEVTSQRTESDGSFEATVKLSERSLKDHRNPVLVVNAQSVWDSNTNDCGDSDTLSAVDIGSATAQLSPAPTPVPPNPTHKATATPAPTATPSPNNPAPTMAAVNTPGRRAETITTSLGSRVNATVTGFADSPTRFDQLTWAIDQVESLIGIPYPAPVLTMSLGIPAGGFCGDNQMEYEARYSHEPYTVERSNIKVEVSERCHQTLGTIVHETAHTWFHGSAKANWIDEGLANAMENQVIAQATGKDYLPATHCESYRNIRELEQANPLRTSTKVSGAGFQGFRCNYSLGDGIFGDLREHYGDQEFNRRIAQLARSRVNATGGDLTVNNVRDVLGDGGRASAIIEEWYRGDPDMRLHRHLDTVEWIQPPITDGEWLRLHGVLQEGQIHNLSSEDTTQCPQFVLYSGIGNLTWVKNVEDPIRVGWTHHHSTKVFAVNHLIDPRTGKFEVTARVLDRALDGHEHLSLLVRSSVGTGPDGKCLQSETYSHVPVQRGDIPDRFKSIKHHHKDAIEWLNEPVLNGTTLTFAGRASPGAINLWHEEDTCSQIGIYSYDNRGYSFVAWVNPQLRDNRRWVNVESEITKGHTYQDGSFEVTATVRQGVMPQGTAALLVITEENPSTGQKCGNPPVLSVKEILR